MDYKKGDCLIVLTNRQGHTFKLGEDIVITKCVEALEGGDFYMARAEHFDKTDYDLPIMAEETFDYAQ